jgi:hypothetical protein
MLQTLEAEHGRSLACGFAWRAARAMHSGQRWRISELLSATEIGYLNNIHRYNSFKSGRTDGLGTMTLLLTRGTPPQVYAP